MDQVKNALRPVVRAKVIEILIDDLYAEIKADIAANGVQASDVTTAQNYTAALVAADNP